MNTVRMQAMLLALPFIGLALGMGAAAPGVVEALPALAMAGIGVVLARAARQG